MASVPDETPTLALTPQKAASSRSNASTSRPADEAVSVEHLTDGLVELRSQ